MVSWRLAQSLETLRKGIDAYAPDRSKVSDGAIGDKPHQGEGKASDHNPNGAGVVCAIDITHDPERGADMGVVSEFLRTHRHLSLTYLIFNRRIASPVQNWIWRPYTGDSPHTEHLHVSASNDYDNTDSWHIDQIGGFLMALSEDEQKKLVEDVRNSKAQLDTIFQQIANIQASIDAYNRANLVAMVSAIAQKVGAA